MKRILVFVTAMVLLVITLPSQPASAAPLTAESFAEDCNDDGIVNIVGDTEYVGGRGFIEGQCYITRSAGSMLEFTNVRLTGQGIVAINSTGSSWIRIVGSQFRLKGVFEMTSGCCSGFVTGVDESGGKILVKDSEITASHIALQASASSAGGYIWIRSSSIISTNSTGVGRGVFFAVGDRGAVDVKTSKFSSLRPAWFESKKQGKTYVYNSRFNRTPRAATGEGGACVTRGNTPSFDCVRP